MLSIYLDMLEQVGVLVLKNTFIQKESLNEMYPLFNCEYICVCPFQSLLQNPIQTKCYRSVRTECNAGGSRPISSSGCTELHQMSAARGQTRHQNIPPGLLVVQ